MKTAVAHTSIRCFDSIGPLTADLQVRIIALFCADTVMTRKQIAREIGLECSTVAGRVNELLRTEHLIEAGTTRCPVSGRVVGALRLPLL